jgi:hypothetical protein
LGSEQQLICLENDQLSDKVFIKVFDEETLKPWSSLPGQNFWTGMPYYSPIQIMQ